MSNEYIQTPQTRLGNSSSKSCLKYNRITNCITEIPQDIKLELQDGVLTLKAGSKLWYPDGFEADGVTKKFGSIIIDTDREVALTGGNLKCLVSANITGNAAQNTSIENSFTVTSSTSYNFSLVYNTTTNIIQRTGNNGEIVYNKSSFPLAIVTQQDNKVVNINQVFNGFGYIGRTRFVLPGVKALIPNGRNPDGSLNSTPFTVENVLTETYPQNNSGKIVVQILTRTITYTTGYYYEQEEQPDGEYVAWYKPSDNLIRVKSPTVNWDKLNGIIYGIFNTVNGRVNNFTINNSFQALDYNNTPYIASQSFPSNKYMDLTLGASGSQYTAPANGWIFISKASTEAWQYITISPDGKYNVTSVGTQSQNINLITPVQKGEKYWVWYDAGGITHHFRFIYTEGEV